MKKFTLTAKRAKKVLALALAAALIVPAIPGQQVDAEIEYYVDMPETLANYPLDKADEFVAEGTTGQAIQFTGEATKATLTSVTGDKSQYQSTDKTPVMDGDNYVMDDIDVTPEIVEDEDRGAVLELKENVTVPQYPAGATYKEDIIQDAAKYNSAVEVANPFAAIRDELYDDSLYTVDKIFATGTEVERYTVTSNTDRFAEYKNRYSAPVAETGVTVSFWAKLPYDETTEKAAVTSFVEFYNDETVLYQTDDLAKNWIAQQYAAAVEAGTQNDVDSPFYAGTVKEATIAALGASIEENFPETFIVGETMKYTDDFGIYGKWNPEAAEMAYENAGGALKVWSVKSISNISEGDWAKDPFNKKYIVVELGNGDYAQLQWSDTVYAEGDEAGKLTQFTSTEEAPKGTFTRYTEGSTGLLDLASNQQFYVRDTSAIKDIGPTGIQQNQTNSSYNTKQGMENNTYAYVYADGAVEGSLMNMVENGDEDWHYLTYTITNEWIQTYIDGVAVDPSKVTTWYGNTFNMGSGIYKPDGTYVTGGNMRSDWQKICNDDFTGSIYGQLFGTPAMKFISDENTELYIGGKTQATYAGTLIDDVTCYGGALTDVQAEYAYKIATGSEDVEYPEALATYNLNDSEMGKDLVANGTTGTAIQFTGEAVLATLTSVTGDKAQYQSTDKTPVMDGDNYVMDDIDVTPEIVEDEDRGAVLELKENVTVPQYPAGATYKEDIIQDAAKYYSGVEVANPFAAIRDDLYDDSLYTADKIFATGTEVERYTVTSNTDRFAEYKNRYSAPVAETGVTVSFWAKLPYDETTEKAAVTSFVEFYNNETVLYQTDDLAKNWIAQQYAAAVEAGTQNDVDSPFYAGTVREATIAALGASIEENFPETFVVGDTMKYTDDFGIYGKWNPEAAEMAYENAGGALKVWSVKSISNISEGDWAKDPFNKKYIVVELGNGDYAQLQWSDTVYAEGDEAGKLTQFTSTEEAPKGTFTRYTEGSTGLLDLASNQQFYVRDTSAIKDIGPTGIQQNQTNSSYNTKQGMENNTYAYVYADGGVEGSLMNAVENGDEDWHYLTYTITNEWIQTYVDGVAVDPSKVTTWYGNTFNMGSGIYKPNSTYVTGGNMRSDWQKICNDDFTGSIYGQLFGTPVMKFISDENTKIYIGGKTQATYAGTLIDSVQFYGEAFSRAQVAAEYAAGDEIDVTTVYGDVNEDTLIDANDALAILKYVAKMDNDTFNEKAANVNADEAVDANDALDVLKYVAKMIEDFAANAKG